MDRIPGPDHTQSRYARETFHCRVDQCLSPNKSSAAHLAMFGDLIGLHMDNMCALGKRLTEVNQWMQIAQTRIIHQAWRYVGKLVGDLAKLKAPTRSKWQDMLPSKRENAVVQSRHLMEWVTGYPLLNSVRFDAWAKSSPRW